MTWLLLGLDQPDAPPPITWYGPGSMYCFWINQIFHVIRPAGTA